MITRDIRFIDGGEKRVKSRMNIPIIYLTRPRADKIKEMLFKRIDYCCRQSLSKEVICQKLKTAIDQKSVSKLITTHY